MYDIFHIFRYIKNNISFYILLTIELIICFTMIIIGIDENEKFEDRLNIYSSLESKDIKYVTDDTNTLYDFKIADYESLNESKFVVAQISYADYVSYNNIETINIVKANKNFFMQYLNLNPKINKGYISIDNNHILSNDLAFLQDSYSLKNGVLYINNSSFDLSTVNINKSIPTSVLEQGDIKPSNTIFLYSNENLNVEYASTLLCTDQNNEIVNNKLEELAKLNNKNLKFVNLKSFFLKGSESQAEFVRLFGWISFICLIVVVLGASGIMILFISKRNSDFRTNYLFGASISRLKRNVFIEIFLICIISVIFSTIISYLIEPRISSVYYTIVLSIKSLVLVMFLSLIVSAFISYISTKNMSFENFRSQYW